MSELLQYDPHLLADPALQWQAQLLAHYSAHMFVAKDFPAGRGAFSSDIEQSLVDASLDVLRLKAEISELHEKNRGLESDMKDLTAENTRLGSRIEDLEDGNRDLNRKLLASAAQARLDASSSTRKPTSMTSRAGPSFAPTGPRSSMWPSQQLPSASVQLNGVTSAHAPPNGPTTSKGKLVCRFEDEMDEDNELFATRIQLEWQEEAEFTSNSMVLALQEQERYEEEDRQLRAQLQQLQEFGQETFDCGVCMDTLPEDVVAQIELCGHKFCR